MSITAVIGGSYGSEGKGSVVAALAADHSVHVRVGAANAGHTIYTHFPCPKDTNGDGDCAMGCDDCPPLKHVLQQLPCAAYANPAAKLVIGAGAQISPHILADELWENCAWRYRHGFPPIQLFIDPRAHVIIQSQIDREAASDLAERIGSTSTIAREGIGEAQADRVRRCGIPFMEWYGKNRHNALALRKTPAEHGLPQIYVPGFRIVDTVKLLHEARAFGTNVLLEGTQGTGLSLTTGQYPYTTSRNVTASGLAADCGLGPKHIDRVIVVIRSYPIRVAGNSGPFYPDSKEITWDEVGPGIDPNLERTTVTKKVRRVATFSMEQAKDAVLLNSADEIALTFADYIDPKIAGRSGSFPEPYERAEHPEVWNDVRSIESETGVPVTFIGTGPHHMLVKPLESAASAV